MPYAVLENVKEKFPVIGRCTYILKFEIAGSQ